ncbi:hypothetical protein [Novosphingobium sp. AP12]|uniref:hypothetical protein n=1 Tax=Novosphingobium sp. AP12 TaxID=1144305 RepID=UPI000271F5E2|nr:hypothetical protein [Novosphingobium sp. AP12]EJL33109.1 hypothetical protein PMI02_01277 [Novosphingobium sp. AP12]
MATYARSAGRHPALPGNLAPNDTLRRKALEKLTLAIARAVESASDDTLADIVGTEDLRHALTIAPRDIAPESSADLAAIKAAREKTARFRDDMASRAGGMLERADVAEMLGVSVAAIEKQRQRRQVLGVLYGNEIRYPAAQFVAGATVANLKQLLEALGDSDPWEQLMLLTTPVSGYGPEQETPLQILARKPGAETLKQVVALVTGWAA